MGYLSIQIIFFLLLAGLLGFLIGWLLRGSRIQTELQELDGRWRTKLGDVENERDRFVNELTQANEARAKLEVDLRRQAEDHEGKIAAFADTETVATGLKSDLAAKADELSKAQAALADVEQKGGEAIRLEGELAAAKEQAVMLEASLKSSKEANSTCKGEVERLKAEIAALKQAASDATGTAVPGGAMGFLGSVDSTTAPSQLAEPAKTDFSHVLGDQSKPSSSSDAPAKTPTDEAVDKADAATAGSSGDDDNEGVKPDLLTAARDGKADDLKKISGVGPKLEKTLNALGVYHFSQIAEFTPDNVSWVDRHLRFKGRIAREKWIEQAKILASGGETEFSKRK